MHQVGKLNIKGVSFNKKEKQIKTRTCFDVILFAINLLKKFVLNTCLRLLQKHLFFPSPLKLYKCVFLSLCLFFFYISTCFVFWIAISLVFWEKWFVKTWKRVAKCESRIAIWNPVTEKAFVPLPLLALKKFLKSLFHHALSWQRIFNSLITLFIYGMKMKKKN